MASTTTAPTEDDGPTEDPRTLARRVPRRGAPPAPVDNPDPDTDDGRALAARVPRRH